MSPAQRKRPQGQLRQGQLITTFGPGAMTDLPERSVLIAGLEDWVGERDLITEPRLSGKISNLLQIPGVRLETPPAAGDIDDQRVTGVRTYRFPEWFVTQDAPEKDDSRRSRFLVHARALSKGSVFQHPETRKKLKVVPVRFVRACRNGHLGDIDWYAFLHGKDNTCRNQGRLLFLDQRGTSGDLSEIWVRCSCGRAEQNMAPTARSNAGVFGHCDGARPWLGPAMRDPTCNELNRLLVRTASNAYFPQRMSVISLPERSETVREAVAAVWDFLETAEDEADVARERRKAKVKDALEGITDAEVWAEIQERRGPGDATEKPIKHAELETLIGVVEEAGEENRPEGVFYARALPRTNWDRPWMSGIEQVVLVHRLREVMALVGFTRFEAAAPDTNGELDMGVRRAEIARNVTWVPAIENRGEGIFLLFRSTAIQQWLAKPAVVERAVQLRRGFDAWKEEHRLSHRLFPGPAFIMLHSFAHLMITTIALECGYPASSIKERIYAIPEIGYGVLLYTGSSDAEGTLGGLVQAGRRIADTVRNALNQGGLCSNDPICSQHQPESQHTRSFLLGAACHGCLLVAETSCEQQNDLLDRSLVVRTVQVCLASWFGPLRHFVLAHLWDVEVLGIIHPRRRRGGGNVGIAVKRFPRSVGRVGKQFHRFPMLSIDRQFHRLFRLTSLLRHRVAG